MPPAFGAAFRGPHPGNHPPDTAESGGAAGNQRLPSVPESALGLAHMSEAHATSALWLRHMERLRSGMAWPCGATQKKERAMPSHADPERV